MYPDLNEEIRKDLETQLGQGKPPRFLEWFFGPGFLGGFVGFLVAAGIMIVFLWTTDFEWNLIVVRRLVICAIAGWFAGRIRGITARDEFLREDWTKFRPLVGFVTGAIIGTIGGAVFWDGWIALAGAIGGGIGGLTDAVVYRSVLESDW